MSNDKYENMAETYNVVCLMNKMKFLCTGVGSHINKIDSGFIPSRLYTILQQSGDTVTNYFDRFKEAQVNAELSKGNLTKNEE